MITRGFSCFRRLMGRSIGRIRVLIPHYRLCVRRFNLLRLLLLLPPPPCCCCCCCRCCCRCCCPCCCPAVAAPAAVAAANPAAPVPLVATARAIIVDDKRVLHETETVRFVLLVNTGRASAAALASREGAAASAISYRQLSSFSE